MTARRYTGRAQISSVQLSSAHLSCACSWSSSREGVSRPRELFKERVIKWWAISSSAACIIMSSIKGAPLWSLIYHSVVRRIIFIFCFLYNYSNTNNNSGKHSSNKQRYAMSIIFVSQGRFFFIRAKGNRATFQATVCFQKYFKGIRLIAFAIKQKKKL